MTPRPATPTPTELRQQILEDFESLRIPLRPEQFDAVLARAEREGMSHLEFVRERIGEQADQRRERSIAHRIREARFRESKMLADFDWQFYAATIDRVRIEALATAEFIGRRANLVLVGQSGVGTGHSQRTSATAPSRLTVVIRSRIRNGPAPQGRSRARME
jgi:DNA replication protein DnaC